MQLSVGVCVMCTCRVFCVGRLKTICLYNGFLFSQLNTHDIDPLNVFFFFKRASRKHLVSACVWDNLLDVLVWSMWCVCFVNWQI